MMRVRDSGASGMTSGPDHMTVVSRSMSRSQIFKALAAGLALATVPRGVQAADGSAGPGTYSFPYFPQVPAGTYTPETPGQILGAIATLKLFDASLGAFSLTNQALLTRLQVTGPLLTVFQAIVAKDQYQVDWLLSLVPGAAPVTTTFTVDPRLAADTQTFATFALFTGYLYMGAELTAVRELAEVGQPQLAKNLAQMAAAEAADTYTFRTLLFASGAPGVTPPNNKAFETDYFLYTRDAIALMRQVGLIGGAGVPLAYPGADAVLAAAGPEAAAVVQRTPNNATSTAPFTSFGTFGRERA